MSSDSLSVSTETAGEDDSFSQPYCRELDRRYLSWNYMWHLGYWNANLKSTTGVANISMFLIRALGSWRLKDRDIISANCAQPQWEWDLMLFSGPGETPNKNKSVWISLWCENNGFWSTGLLKQTNILVLALSYWKWLLRWNEVAFIPVQMRAAHFS